MKECRSFGELPFLCGRLDRYEVRRDGIERDGIESTTKSVHAMKNLLLILDFERQLRETWMRENRRRDELYLGPVGTSASNVSELLCDAIACSLSG